MTGFEKPPAVAHHSMQTATETTFALKSDHVLANALRKHVRELGIQGVHSLISKKEYILIPLRHQMTSEQLENVKTMFLPQNYQYSDLIIEQIAIDVTENLKINKSVFNGHLQSFHSKFVEGISLPLESARRKRSRLRSEKQRAKHDRGIIFTDWLCETYGMEFLRSGCGVLDVAGGKGEVAFQLSMIKHIACTVVDPMPIKLSKSKTRMLVERAKLQDNTNRINDNPICEAKKQWFCQEIVKIISEDLLSDTIRELDLMDQRQCLFNDDFVNQEDGLWSQTSMVVGIHPDEATEPIVDAALQCGKPFAVVPCCVFPNTNSHRRTLNGEKVILYSHLIQYLQEKDPLIQVHTLAGLPGRNVVVFKR